MFKKNKSPQQGAGGQRRAAAKVSPKLLIVILAVLVLLALTWWAVSLFMAPGPQKKPVQRTPRPAPAAVPTPAPAPVPAPAPADAVEVKTEAMALSEGDQAFTETYTVYFRHRSYYVDGTQRREIRKFLAGLETLKGLKFELDAYTDNTGKKSYNKYLSKRRARSVRDYLKKRGISGSVIRMAYHGEKAPEASNKRESGRKQNRRVVITVSPME